MTSLNKEAYVYALCDMYNRIYGEDYTYEKEFDILSELIEEHFRLIELLGLNKKYETLDIDDDVSQKMIIQAREYDKKVLKEHHEKRIESLKKELQELKKKLPEYIWEMSEPKRHFECDMKLEKGQVEE